MLIRVAFSSAYAFFRKNLTLDRADYRKILTNAHLS